MEINLCPGLADLIQKGGLSICQLESTPFSSKPGSSLGNCTVCILAGTVRKDLSGKDSHHRKDDEQEGLKEKIRVLKSSLPAVIWDLTAGGFILKG